jgi:hypothetical protein
MNAWGNSWGSAWGNSWGTTIFPPISSVGGGGGGKKRRIEIWEKEQPFGRPALDFDIQQAADAAYEELAPVTARAKENTEEKKEYIDWVAVEKDVQEVRNILELSKKQKALEEDDELAILLLS